jgi:hypothetical protein
MRLKKPIVCPVLVLGMVTFAYTALLLAPLLGRAFVKASLVSATEEVPPNADCPLENKFVKVPAAAVVPPIAGGEAR